MYEIVGLSAMALLIVVLGWAKHQVNPSAWPELVEKYPAPKDSDRKLIADQPITIMKGLVNQGFGEGITYIGNTAVCKSGIYIHPVMKRIPRQGRDIPVDVEPILIPWEVIGTVRHLYNEQLSIKLRDVDCELLFPPSSLEGIRGHIAVKSD